jgi:hypothetical protein
MATWMCRIKIADVLQERTLQLWRHMRGTLSRSLIAKPRT